MKKCIEASGVGSGGRGGRCLPWSQLGGTLPPKFRCLPLNFNRQKSWLYSPVNPTCSLSSQFTTHSHFVSNHQTQNITYGDVFCSPKFYLFCVRDTAIKAVTYIVFDVVFPALAVQDACGLPKRRCRSCDRIRSSKWFRSLTIDYLWIQLFLTFRVRSSQQLCVLV